jgi:hypothetical protein
LATKKNLVDKIRIHDEAGSDIAYVNNGVVDAASSGRRIATILGGVVFGADGQVLGRRTPSGTIRGVDGVSSMPFMRLVKPE